MIYVSDKAKEKVEKLMQEAHIEGQPDFFLRVSVVGGGCSGLSYKMDFDNQSKPTDQVFEDKGIKVVTDLKSFLYLGGQIFGFYLRFEWQGISFQQSECFKKLCLWRKLCCLGNSYSSK